MTNLGLTGPDVTWPAVPSAHPSPLSVFPAELSAPDPPKQSFSESSIAGCHLSPIGGYVQFDWCRKPKADPVCRATGVYLERGRPASILSDELTDVIDIRFELGLRPSRRMCSS